MRGPAVLAIGLLLTACGGAGTPTTVAIKSATSSSVTVETTTTTAAILEGIDSLSASAAPYDGTWAGTTSEGEDIAFTIESRAVTFVVIGFTSDECAEDSPMSAQAFGTPLGAVEGGKLTARLAGLYVAEINGSFTSESTAAGDVTLQLGSRCGGVRALTWAADLLAEGDPLPGSDEWYGWPPPAGALPEVTMEDRLYDLEGGTTKFDETSGVFESNGDWYLVGTGVRAFVAVPAGWTTSEIGGAFTYLMFSEERDLVVDPFEGIVEGEEEAYADISIDFDAASIGELLGSWMTAFANAEIGVIASALVDEQHAYVLGDMPLEGDTRRVLVVLGRNNLEGGNHVFRAIFDTEDQWDDYYPIMQAMVESWHTLDGAMLGFALPDNLP